MNKKTINIELPQFEGVELRSATVDLEKGVVVAEYEQEESKKDISEIAVNLVSAVVYLDEDIHKPNFLTTKKHMLKLEAFSLLLILAEAWNSFDEFTPNWDDLDQEKFCPFFQFINGNFEFSHAGFVRWVLNAHISNFSFKTKERAEQFGRQFIHLFRIVLSS